MSEGVTANHEVADIYQSMLNGDKSALYKLQQIKIMGSLPRFSQGNQNKKTKINTEENVHNQEESQYSQKSQSRNQNAELKVSSVVNIGNKKQQMYLNVIRRGAKLGNSNNEKPPRIIKQKKWPNSSNREYSPEAFEQKLQPKPIIEQKPSQLLEKQFKINRTAQVQLPKNNKIYALPKVPRPRQIAKIQSAQATVSQKNTSMHQSNQLNKSIKKQKIDFKDMIGKSKKQRFDVQKRNEQQLKAQLDLVSYHKSTKDFLALVKDKYNLNFKNKKKFLKHRKGSQEIRQSIEPQQINSPDKKTLVSLHLEQEKGKCLQIIEDVNILKILYNRNTAALSKKEKQTAALPFAKYLENRGDSVSSISEEEEDLVEPLQTSTELRNKYKHLMAHTKDRKWGLMQRTQYQVQRTQSLGQSRRTGDSRMTHAIQDKIVKADAQQNKVTINERLKNLLFT